jgi:hypothetical protein
MDDTPPSLMENVTAFIQLLKNAKSLKKENDSERNQPAAMRDWEENSKSNKAVLLTFLSGKPMHSILRRASLRALL